MGRLLFLFIVVPLVELVLLLYLADWTSWWFTILLIVVTGIVGSSLARVQGGLAWQRVQNELNTGRMPTTSLVDGLLIFAAGLLLITPGVLTDIVGFSLLIPFSRSWYRKWLTRWYRGRFHVQMTSWDLDTNAESTQDPNVVDSYVVHPDKSSDKDSDDDWSKDESY